MLPDLNISCEPTVHVLGVHMLAHALLTLEIEELLLLRLTLAL